MFRLAVTFLLIVSVLPACRPTYPVAELEAEAAKQHSLPDLLLWHEKVVASEKIDFFFIEPIGRYGRGGVVATLDHIASKGRAAYSNDDLRLLFGVMRAAENEVGYDLCADKLLLRELTGRRAEPGVNLRRRSKFAKDITDFCIVTEKLSACNESVQTPEMRQNCEEGRALMWGGLPNQAPD